MMRFLKIPLLVLLAVASAMGWAAESKQGGQGVMTTNFSTDECFTGSGVVAEVCARYQIHWKLWSLMGEPVGDYSLKWELLNVKLRSQKGAPAVSFTPDTVPEALRRGVEAIEIYIDAVASVRRQMHVSGLELRFNTGTATRAGKPSFNVPGSPSWGDLFIRTLGDACDKEVKHLDEKAAKETFKAGVELYFSKRCEGSGLSNLTPLESAVVKMCEAPGASERHRFCAPSAKKPKKEEAKTEAQDKKKEPPADKTKNDAELGLGAAHLDGTREHTQSSVSNLLDEKAEAPAVQKRLAEERQRYRGTADAKCKSIMKDIDACFKRAQCPRPEVPSGLSEADCKTAFRYVSPSYAPALVLTREDPSCDRECRKRGEREAEARREEEKRERIRQAEAREREWHAKWDPVRARCEPFYAAQEHYKTCEQKTRASCNPGGVGTQEECINQQMQSSGPSEKDARKSLQKEWEQRSRGGSSITNSILD